MKRLKPTSKHQPRLAQLAGRITAIIETARKRVQTVVDHEMVRTYWQIGREIVEDEQKGEKRAGYGEYVLINLSPVLTKKYGKGFDYSNLKNMRQFYLAYPIGDALRSQLSWTHYRLLMRVDDSNKRSFYEVESATGNWSTRELERQMNSMLFERLALSKDKKGLLALAREGQTLKEPSDMVKDPYVLEFLGLP
jgi:predicted nuclease of restriction endonuclease-like (RecB) superfamily